MQAQTQWIDDSAGFRLDMVQPTPLDAQSRLGAYSDSASVPEWYCTRVAPQCESAADKALKLLGVSAWFPRLERVDATRHRRQGPLFPGYGFVHTDIMCPAFRLAWFHATRDPDKRRLRLALLGQRDAPKPLLNPVMAELLAMADADGIVRDKPRQAVDQIGATYRVNRGQWALFAGVCDATDRDRVRLLLSLFGRQCSVWVRAKDCDAIG
jgi:transcription antitermination factor NusG